MVCGPHGAETGAGCGLMQSCCGFSDFRITVRYFGAERIPHSYVRKIIGAERILDIIES